LNSDNDMFDEWFDKGLAHTLASPSDAPVFVDEVVHSMTSFDHSDYRISFVADKLKAVVDPNAGPCALPAVVSALSPVERMKAELLVACVLRRMPLARTQTALDGCMCALEVAFALHSVGSTFLLQSNNIQTKTRRTRRSRQGQNKGSGRPSSVAELVDFPQPSQSLEQVVGSGLAASRGTSDAQINAITMFAKSFFDSDIPTDASLKRQAFASQVLLYAETARPTSVWNAHFHLQNEEMLGKLFQLLRLRRAQMLREKAQATPADTTLQQVLNVLKSWNSKKHGGYHTSYIRELLELLNQRVADEVLSWSLDDLPEHKEHKEHKEQGGKDVNAYRAVCFDLALGLLELSPDLVREMKQETLLRFVQRVVEHCAVHPELAASYRERLANALGNGFSRRMHARSSVYDDMETMQANGILPLFEALLALFQIKGSVPSAVSSSAVAQTAAFRHFGALLLLELLKKLAESYKIRLSAQGE